MNITLTVVVAAIVILITALVVLTIFGGGMGQVGTLAQAETICKSQCESTCQATNRMPLTWNIATVRQGTEMKSCADIGVSCPCGDGSGTTGGTTGQCTQNGGHCVTKHTPTSTCPSMGSSPIPGPCPSNQLCCA